MDLTELKDPGGRRHPWEISRIRALRAILRDDVKEDLTVLDMGCGDGYVARELLRGNAAARVTAFDKNLTAKKIIELKQVMGEGIAFTNRLPERGAFKLILLLDVLEHVEDDRGFLRETNNRYLGDGGRILITAPAFNFLFGHHDKSLGHYRRYNLGELSRLTGAAGLEIMSSGYLFFTLLVPKIIGNALFKKSMAKGVGDWRGGPFITGLFGALLSLDAGLGILLSRAGLKIPGLTVWLLCEKRR